MLVTSIVISSLLDINTHAATGYFAEFTNASGLQPGDTVRIAGVEVGKVSAVTLQGNHAQRHLQRRHLPAPDHHTRTPPSTSRTSWDSGSWRSCRAQPGGKPLHPGSVIPMSRTTPALDLTAVFDGFQPLFSALAPDQVNELAGSIIQVFQGESGTVSTSCRRPRSITINLADRQQVIDGLLNNLSTLLNTVGAHDTQLGQLIGSFDTLVRGLAASRIRARTPRSPTCPRSTARPAT